jgi:hypothetical protein
MKNLLIKIIGWLSGSTKTVFQFLMPILAYETAQLLAKLLPIALDVVSGLADTSKTGPQKQSAAVDQIKTIALQAGINASTRAVNLAVELALAKLEGQVK